MIGEDSYTYLTSVLEAEMRKAYKGFKERPYGRSDKVLEAKKVAHLRGLVKNIICKPENPLIFTSSRGGIYIYNGKYCESVGDGASFLSELIERVFTRLHVSELYRMYGSEKIARSIMRSLESSDVYQYRTNRQYIAFKNGIFDLKNGKLTSFDRSKIPAIVLDFEYTDPKTLYSKCANKFGTFDNPCRRWNKFINEVFDNDEFRDVFQCFCGLLLVDRDEIKVEYMACIFGPGSNGKSVLAECIAKVFGKEYYSTFTPQQLFKQGSSSMFCVADLDGKILNVVGDLDRADFSSGEFKSFVSGEDVRAREPYGRKFHFIKPPLMLCCTNLLPKTSDDSEGYHRRILPIRSTKEVFQGKKRDVTLTSKLTQDEARCYIFSWIYDGYKKVRDNNWDIPLSQDVLDAIEQTKNQSNSMRIWWTGGDCPWRLPKKNEKGGKWVKFKEMYTHYKKWCYDNGEKETNSVELGRMLRSVGFREEGENRTVERKGTGMAYRVMEKEVDEIKD